LLSAEQIPKIASNSATKFPSVAGGVVLEQWLSDEESHVIFPVASPVLLEMSRRSLYEVVENDCEAEQEEIHLLNSSAVLAFADAAEELRR
jgi:hypothetical protein